MSLPDPPLTPQRIADLAGPSRKLYTIDVATQEHGPRYNLQQYADYFQTPPRQRGPLLNVVSLQLAGTPLQVGLQNPELETLSCNPDS